MSIAPNVNRRSTASLPSAPAPGRKPLWLARFLAVPLLLACSNGGFVSPPLSGERLFERVERYAAFGEHRTGGTADRATSRWLAEELISFGFAVERQPFVVSQFFPEDQRLEVGDDSIPVFPHWLPRASAGPIRAPIAPLDAVDLSGKIAFLAPESAGAWYQVRPSRLAETARSKGAVALAIALPHPSREIYATNAAPPFLNRELPLPTVILASRDAPAVVAAMTSGMGATLISNGAHREVEASNLLARYPETPLADAPWVVVSTPTSGWFQCGGERGSGVALFLGLAEAVASRGSATGPNWLFVANSGHELAFAGARRSIERVPPPEDVEAWLHLGASIAAREWADVEGVIEPLGRVHDFNRLFYSSELESLAQATFSNVPDLELLPAASLRHNHSELREILDEGYPAAGFVGPHRFFHTRRDTPDVTSPTLLSPYGEALQDFLLRLTGSASSSRSETDRLD